VLVEIYSDVVCPWCYIGKRRFERAMAQFAGHDDVEVVWRPFQLDPTAPSTATPVADVYAAKFGSAERALRIIRHVTEVAATEGLSFDLFNAKRANTFDAHRVIGFAAERGMQDAVKERLLRAYFTEGRDVGDPDVLAALAAEAGLDEVEVKELLASLEGVEELRCELGRAIELGISAVPTFVFEGKWAVHGAHDAETMLSVLEQVALRSVGTVDGADACDGETCPA
jgi:predicted DsbA family dithiol-disulfide isomerase